MYIQSFSIHGLIRGASPELGRDADTGGQVKYVLELARALSGRPRLLLLDEVMAGLNDAELEASIEIIRKIRDQFHVTIIWVEHVMKAVLGISDKVMVLNAGELIFEGTCDEVIDCTEVIEAYLGEYDYA